MRLLPLLFVLSGCHSLDPPAAESPPVRPALTRIQETGRRIYLRRCSACHGEQGDGSGRNSPNLTKPPEFSRSLTRAAISDWLRGRRPRTAPECPDWQHTFSEAERRAVADYVLTLLKR
jgi:mono/diheme cytochrome c family protein